jgi:hypothetical protein
MTQLARMVLDVFHCLPNDALSSICLWIGPIPTSPKRLSLVENQVLSPEALVWTEQLYELRGI